MWTVSRRIDAPAATVWNILTDLDDWPKWGLTVSGAALAGVGPLGLGSKGKVWTPVGVPLAFEITEFEPGRMWSWNVVGVPATKHGVNPEGNGCRVWMSSPVWAPAYLPVLVVALRRIDQLAHR
ncbi:MAG: SRPBCC family protein [Mycobacterium sp.]